MHANLPANQEELDLSSPWGIEMERELRLFAQWHAITMLILLPQFDYFHWNFLFGFVVVTIIIVIGNIYLNVRTVAFGVPFIVIQVCSQCLFIAVLRSMGWRVPFRISSVAAHEPARSGVYLLAEDIVGVDGGQGQTFRRELAARYEASETVRNLCWRLDIMWGISGIIVGGGIIAILYAVPSANLAFILGEASLPSLGE